MGLRNRLGCHARATAIGFAAGIALLSAAGCGSSSPAPLGSGSDAGMGDDSSPPPGGDASADGSTCAPHQTRCGASCTDTSSDPANCGTCGTACATGQTCLGGICSVPCSGGNVSCGGKCVMTSTDLSNCGGCGLACSTNNITTWRAPPARAAGRAYRPSPTATATSRRTAARPPAETTRTPAAAAAMPCSTNHVGDRHLHLGHLQRRVRRRATPTATPTSCPTAARSRPGPTPQLRRVRPACSYEQHREPHVRRRRLQRRLQPAVARLQRQQADRRLRGRLPDQRERLRRMRDGLLAQPHGDRHLHRGRVQRDVRGGLRRLQRRQAHRRLRDGHGHQHERLRRVRHHLLREQHRGAGVQRRRVRRRLQRGLRGLQRQQADRRLRDGHEQRREQLRRLQDRLLAQQHGLAGVQRRRLRRRLHLALPRLRQQQADRRLRGRPADQRGELRRLRPRLLRKQHGHGGLRRLHVRRRLHHGLRGLRQQQATDGCEVDTQTDAKNCGACGHACATGESCVNSACQTCNTSVLLLSDGNTALDATVSAALTAAGLVPTVIDTGATTYAGTPAATGFGAILVEVGSSYSTDMPAAGQSAIVSAFNAGAGAVFTEWAAYEAFEGRWVTLKPLLLTTYATGTIQGLGTYTLSSAAHPVWTGLPATFTTTVDVASASGVIVTAGSASPPASSRARRRSRTASSSRTWWARPDARCNRPRRRLRRHVDQRSEPGQDVHQRRQVGGEVHVASRSGNEARRGTPPAPRPLACAVLHGGAS